LQNEKTSAPVRADLQSVWHDKRYNKSEKYDELENSSRIMGGEKTPWFLGQIPTNVNRYGMI